LPESTLWQNFSIEKQFFDARIPYSPKLAKIFPLTNYKSFLKTKNAQFLGVFSSSKSTTRL
jgi:hypothetical protein